MSLLLTTSGALRVERAGFFGVTRDEFRSMLSQLITGISRSFNGVTVVCFRVELLTRVVLSTYIWVRL